MCSYGWERFLIYVGPFFAFQYDVGLSSATGTVTGELDGGVRVFLVCLLAMLGPLVSAVIAPVSVLELFLFDYGGLAPNCLLLIANLLNIFELNVKSLATPRAVSEKLGHSRSIFFVFFVAVFRPFVAAVAALVGVLEILYVNGQRGALKEDN